ncbi:hypothetical protein CDD83_1098 [Cordyceps sp. RAO-2017]|nr:hypothetical protein CDD83_1098 [Cordyceps sp. RAO-2017]
MAMSKALALAAALLAAPVLGDYGQAVRCFKRSDPSARFAVGQLLQSADDCVTNGDKPVLTCARERLEREALPVVSTLINQVRTWEGYSRTLLELAYDEHGKGTGTSDNAWALLREHWETTGHLCYYSNEPSVADHLVPREAGLLSLFFNRGDLRSPILKLNAVWRYDGDVICAAQDGPDRQRQNSIVASLGEIWDADDGRKTDVRQGFLAEYSTDPFLQAWISAWHAPGSFVCPEGHKCVYNAVVGSVYRPPSVEEFQFFVSNRMAAGSKLCIISKNGLRPGDLSGDTFYVSSVS